MFAILFIIAFVAIILGVDFYVGSFGRGSLYKKVENVPHKKAAMVLGTIKYVHGRKNLYYEYRLDAAMELWKAGKVDAILVLGDNSRKSYDEPSAMKEDLIKRGVPGEYISVDYAGFRTLDSVVRAQEIFSLGDYIVVSQKFHCERAMYLAKKKDQNISGYCAKDVTGRSGTRNRFREILARNKAVLDIITGKGPKYLGPKVEMNYKSNQEH